MKRPVGTLVCAALVAAFCAAHAQSWQRERWGHINKAIGTQPQ